MLKMNEDRKRYNKKPVDPRTFLIMDDCMSAKNEWMKDPNVLSIMNEGRHFQLTYILTMQYCLGIQPELRSQCDFIFMLGEDGASSRRKLYDHWAGVFPKFDIFEQVFNQVTDNYGCMVINNRIRSIDLRKKVFWFRAKKTPNFKIGSQLFIRFNEKHFDEHYADRKGQFMNLMNITKKNAPNVRVKMLSGSSSDDERS
jgi:hypothetical protein